MSLNEVQVQRMAVTNGIEMFQLVIATFLGVSIVTWPGSSAFAEKRLALLIGNKNYGPQVGALKNPHKDIALIDKALQQVGFSVVSRKDLGRAEMMKQIDEFVERLSNAGPGAVGFFYYVGHGVSRPRDHINYLIPIDIQNMQDPNLWWNAIALDAILNELERDAPNASHFVIFDACRNELRLPVRSAVKGFEPVTDRNGVFTAFSTRPNSSASDVGEDSGLYAQALASELIRPGQDHLTLFQNVKERVYSATGRTQWPWESNGLLQRFYFAGAPDQQQPPKPALSPPVTETPNPTPPSPSGGTQGAVGNYPQAPMSPITRQKLRAFIDTKFGSIEIRFFPEKAPKHVENFIKLAQSGFYDRTIFHRVIPGFMIQGGDPNTKDARDKSKYGTGGPGYNVEAEFNDYPHVRGAVSMARSQDPNSAGSQFFIVTKDSPSLNGKYTVFGEVVKGMEVADKIVSQERDARDNPLERIEMTVRIVN